MQQGLLNQPTISNTDPHTKIEKQVDGEGGNSQTADLNQQQHHQLTEQGQLGSGIDHGQAGDALSRGRCKQRIEKG